MVNYRKYISSVAVLASGFFLAQSTVSTVLYSQAYDNQRSTLNLPSPVTSVAEKTFLSAKELVDINVNTMMTDPVLKNATWGFVVYDPKTKKIISSYNENTPLVPASTTKLLTTETAMNLLGENYRWMTQLEYSGTIDENGVLNGNLYLIGSGDPSLGTNKAGAWSYRDIISDFMGGLSREGIKKVNGDIIIQTALFKGNIAMLPENVVWLENNNYYLPVGTTREINPANEKLIVKKSGFTSDKKYFYVSPYVKQMVYAEKYEGNGTLTTKLPDAPAYLANTLRTTLVKSGIGVTGKVTPKMTDATPETRKLVSAYKSPTLGDIIFYTNQHSDNSLAEALLKTVGFQKMGDQTSESGRVVVTEHLKNESFDMIGLNYMDGSGLSRSNNVTPISQVKFLTSLMDEKYYKTYLTSLPVGGQSGTLKRMFIGTGNGQVFAKTGTLNKVKTLAGYLKTNSGKTLVFSLMVNNYAGSVDMVKKRMEKILEPALDL
ncbi:D-alanyl-D-alanine carboxypeptidase/D-alanyl-D-alanine endopeptidase [Chryseobacterium carnipullorum]|uniref:D-alanyl-D-alanine carboxypeptidase/D-alanyl-D-alanine endopeptidase n=1 Tax=Chryseobacterium carnipullorum TaxID=1124835 RepID=UPI000E825BB1|nr:D-alanyl-D-alanine carboxypeptidase/D-alanyl-D-alanine-endopeptidase [Chryseobacterium carnipullorum]MDN5397439.1 D-alanyl-D-alanine carboxypeptidase/D-alanyl-D-alanine-endopeptidase [Chryseobacterium sp.]MDN5477279.1 D-alanyl-D-alanine carboxypeptidase/D-alanyl-D-alanine-endopeptidase [Chryseobacterium sp.]MDN5480851.1 D-alanyl-D-alanine carboxypeptidase/D-alanyl-D-alanine-endopeptidase [Chryseobacterium sp.]HBV14884.1 D-alanyl-D-alanine carboxypeptidase/D-alanyl-D-alanine-endopeptidase [Ch